ncbi:MAG: hypothetical protein BWK78_07295 [Thiotrichaceae bacterium IS1]|nr:MAG: hypothetical protein BWK78_07295 [Thiotrichaceae bacterium IS1]
MQVNPPEYSLSVTFTILGESKHFFLTLGMSLFLMSACSAQPRSPDEETSSSNHTSKPLINQPSSANKPLPATPDPLPPENEKTAPDPKVEKSTPHAPIVAPRPPIGGEETQPANQNQPRPQPCDGMTTDAVSPSVQNFLTCEVIQILAKPERVQSFKVKPDPDPSVPEDQRLGNYPIVPNGKGPNLNADQLRDLQTRFFSEKSYVFGVEKRCRFRPEMGLHFTKGREAVDVLFSFECDLWLFIHKGEEKLEDFDPVHKELTQLRKSLFPAGDTPTQN